MFCPSCGHENDPDAKFCVYCGTSLVKSYAARNSAPAESAPESPLPEADRHTSQESFSQSSWESLPKYSPAPLTDDFRTPLPWGSMASSRHTSQGSSPQSSPAAPYSAPHYTYVSAPSPRVSPAAFTMIAPAKFKPDTYNELQFYVFDEAYRYIVERARARFGKTAESQETYSDIPLGAAVTIKLSSPDEISFDENEAEQIWNGKYLLFPFAVRLGGGLKQKTICINARVYIDGICVTKLQVLPKVKGWKKQQLDAERHDIRTAFLSYASEDIEEAMLIKSTIEKVNRNIDIFFDKENLRSGDRWLNVLEDEIEKREMLYLCWSRNAKASEWVSREWHHALQVHGIDSIDPFPLELPEECPPPDELASLHFNDEKLYVRKYYEIRKAGM